MALSMKPVVFYSSSLSNLLRYPGLKVSERFIFIMKRRSSRDFVWCLLELLFQGPKLLPQLANHSHWSSGTTPNLFEFSVCVSLPSWTKDCFHILLKLKPLPVDGLAPPTSYTLIWLRRQHALLIMCCPVIWQISPCVVCVCFIH